MFGEKLEKVRETSPLIHNITNYVTANDCANILLACGASPTMADDASEVEEITTISNALNINIGTLNAMVTGMFLAGKKANELGRPVVLDPVGAGASRLRTDTACRLIDEIRFTVIRGNISEIKTLASGSGTTKGVDADAADIVTEDTLDSTVAFVKTFAAKTGAVIAVTGAIDLVSDAERTFVIRNGRPMMGRVTGTGCMLHDRRLSGRKPGMPAGSGCGCCVRHGRMRGDRFGTAAGGGRKRHLPQPPDRRNLSSGRTYAGRKGAL